MEMELTKAIVFHTLRMFFLFLAMSDCNNKLVHDFC